MDDLETEIERAQQQIQQATEDLKRAVRRRTTASKAGLKRARYEAAVVAAREAVTAAEVRLRALYEAKGDWVRLSQGGPQMVAPAQIASD